MAIIRWIFGSSDPMFFTKLYYQQQESKAIAHFVMRPLVDISKVGVVSA